jgi:hypothetical protein
MEVASRGDSRVTGLLLLILGAVGFAMFLVWLKRHGKLPRVTVDQPREGTSWCEKCRHLYRFAGWGRAAEQFHADFDCCREANR